MGERGAGGRGQSGGRAGVPCLCGCGRPAKAALSLGPAGASCRPCCFAQSPSTSACISLMARLTRPISPGRAGYARVLATVTACRAGIGGRGIADYAGRCTRWLKHSAWHRATCSATTGAAIAVQLGMIFRVPHGPWPCRDRPVEPRNSRPCPRGRRPSAGGGRQSFAGHGSGCGKRPGRRPGLLQRELLLGFQLRRGVPGVLPGGLPPGFRRTTARHRLPVLVYAGVPIRCMARSRRQRGPAAGVATTLPGGEHRYVCERQADIIAARLAEFLATAGYNRMDLERNSLGWVASPRLSWWI